MQSIFLFGIYCAFFLIGTQATFVFALGYVWVDLFRPQIVNPAIMGTFPLSMIMGAAAIVGYLGADRRDPPKLSITIVLMGLLAIWMVISTYLLAVLPIEAQAKHDWAFKTLFFAMFIPYIFRSRVQIEALILVVLASSAGNVLAYAGKLVVGGSFYGQSLGLSRSDSGFGETSTFALVCAALIPLVLFSMRHSVIIPQFPMRRVAHLAACAFFVLALYGTHARAGLVALAVLAILLWIDARRKILLAGLLAGAIVLALPFAGEKWLDRMETITNPTADASALGRIVVWQWTWQYVKANPLGGGFDVYRINRFTSTQADGTTYSIASKAFHSIYFEVLGELGFPGFFLLMSLFAITLIKLYRIRWQTHGDPDLAWLYDLSKALTTSLIVYMVGGAFVGIAFQPLHYDWMALTVSMSAYLQRYRTQQAAEAVIPPGWSRLARPAAGLGVGTRPASWRA